MGVLCTMLEHDHDRRSVRGRLMAERRPSYIRDWVYGGIDGAITTFAIVAGVVGASLSARIILILGLANLIADGLSMAASNYSGTKTEVDELARHRAIEKRHIREMPEGEREEVRQIMAMKGLEGDALDAAVEAITSNEETWVRTMIADEYGLTENLRDPLKSGLSTFAAFVLCGAVPLAPFLFLPPDSAFTISLAMTLVVFFAIGSLKSRWALTRWWASGLETLAIGSVAALAAFAIGYALRGYG